MGAMQTILFPLLLENRGGERGISFDKNKRICITGQVINVRNVNKITASMNTMRTCSIYTICNRITPQGGS
jgi:hypothetical protein